MNKTLVEQSSQQKDKDKKIEQLSQELQTKTQQMDAMNKTLVEQSSQQNDKDEKIEQLSQKAASECESDLSLQSPGVTINGTNLEQSTVILVVMMFCATTIILKCLNKN